jgi:hypothetical protein
VYDNLFAGFSQPLIGTFNIDIGDIKRKTEEEQKDFRNRSKCLIRDLRDKLKEKKKMKNLMR